jgi:hypothetical protein
MLERNDPRASSFDIVICCRPSIMDRSGNNKIFIIIYTCVLDVFFDDVVRVRIMTMINRIWYWYRPHWQPLDVIIISISSVFFPESGRGGGSSGEFKVVVVRYDGGCDVDYASES